MISLYAHFICAQVILAVKSDPRVLVREYWFASIARETQIKMSEQQS